MCPVTQFQILSRNPDSSAAFYSKLFGWSVNADNPLGYRMLNTGSDRGIHGGIWPAPPEANAFVQLFVEVDDMAARIESAVALGARVIMPPQTLPAGERLAVIQDPEGIAVALWSPAAP